MFAAVENTSESVPAFLVKLWTLVEDPSTDNLIQWDSSGTSFHVYDQQSFSREILPLYFKHNNIASFIRQLNMYGFRKVAHIEQGGLKVEKDDLQFQHQYFQRGERELLQYIKRKVSARASDSLAAAKPDEYSRVLTDVKQVKLKQENMEHNLEYIKRENKLLWREVATLRQKHHKQQQIVNKLIQFLVSLVSSNRTGLTIPPIRRMPLAINDVSQLAASPPPPSTTTSAQLAQQPQGTSKVQATGTTSNVNSGTAFTLDPASQTVEQGYSIESPKMENFLLSPTESSSGPIIHELTEPQIVHALIPVSVGEQQRSGGEAGQPVVQTMPSSSGTNMVLGPRQVVVLPAKVSQQSVSTGSPPDTLAGTALMSPKIEVAPSLEDALNFGLIVPSTSATVATAAVSPPQSAAQTKRKRKGQQQQQQQQGVDGSPSPTKKSQQGSYMAMGSTPPGMASPRSQDQPTAAGPMAKAVVGQVDPTATAPLDANLAVTASKDNDEYTLSSDQLDLLSSDMDGLKSILQEQYKVDPSFLMELFESSNPWPVIPEKDLDELKVDSEKDDAIASTSDGVNILGNELVEYNPREELFPELMADNIMADIDDID